jgi:hypothetical protein
MIWKTSPFGKIIIEGQMKLFISVYQFFISHIIFSNEHDSTKNNQYGEQTGKLTLMVRNH